MGQASTKGADISDASRFATHEIATFDRTFEDLAARSNGQAKKKSSGIDKATFLRLFNLPGVLGERVFAVFDVDKNNSIEHSEFLSGIKVMMRGDNHEKLTFIFQMFDMDGTNILNREELRAMLNSLVFATSDILENSNVEKRDEDVEHANDDAQTHILDDQVEGLLDDAFGVPPAEQLSFSQFHVWITNNPRVYEIFEDIFQNSLSLAGLLPSSDGSPAVGTIISADPDIDTPARRPSSSSLQSSRRGSASDLLRSRHSASHPNLVSMFSTSALSNEHDFTSRVSSNSPPHCDMVHPTPHSEPVSQRGQRRNNRTHSSAVGVVISCSHCGHETCVTYCFSCGTLLNSENRPCRTCGEQFNGHMVKFCMACGFDLSLNNKKIEPPLQRNHVHKKHEASVQGFLFKIGATFKQPTPRWFVLKDSFLYCFRERGDVQPLSVTFMEGCFIEACSSTEHEKLRYGIDIIVADSGSKQDEQHKVLYAKTLEEREQWMAALLRSTNVHNIDEFYEIGKELGTGRFSSVRLGTHLITGKKYAIKIIDKSGMEQKEREALRAEIAVLKLVKHPNVIHLKNQFETRRHMYIVMGLCSGGDLFERLVQKKRFPEPVVCSIIKKVLAVVLYLHERGIVHRDLKPENIMVSSIDRDDDIVIGDFGLSKFKAPHEIMKLPCGTLAYVAPEVLTMQGYGQKVDIWSVGIIAYLLLRGKLPFDSSKKQEVIEKTKAGVIDFSGDLWTIVSASARDFITKCLQVDPEKRCSVDTALAHPWIVNAVDPYPELTARETMRHQQHLLEVQLHHQQELLAQLHCTCPPHTQLSRSQSAPNSNTRSSSPPASQIQATGNPDITIVPVSFAERCQHCGLVIPSSNMTTSTTFQSSFPQPRSTPNLNALAAQADALLGVALQNPVPSVSTFSFQSAMSGLPPSLSPYQSPPGSSSGIPPSGSNSGLPPLHPKPSMNLQHQILHLQQQIHALQKDSPSVATRSVTPLQNVQNAAVASSASSAVQQFVTISNMTSSKQAPTSKIESKPAKPQSGQLAMPQHLSESADSLSRTNSATELV